MTFSFVLKRFKFLSTVVQWHSGVCNLYFYAFHLLIWLWLWAATLFVIMTVVCRDKVQGVVKWLLFLLFCCSSSSSSSTSRGGSVLWWTFGLGQRSLWIVGSIVKHLHQEETMLYLTVKDLMDMQTTGCHMCLACHRIQGRMKGISWCVLQNAAGHHRMNWKVIHSIHDRMATAVDLGLHVSGNVSLICGGSWKPLWLLFDKVKVNLVVGCTDDP